MDQESLQALRQEVKAITGKYASLLKEGEELRVEVNLVSPIVVVRENIEHLAERAWHAIYDAQKREPIREKVRLAKASGRFRANSPETRISESVRYTANCRLKDMHSPLRLMPEKETGDLVLRLI